jgi:Cu(I)/Ag(I) efflux system membrane fusion protein
VKALSNRNKMRIAIVEGESTALFLCLALAAVILGGCSKKETVGQAEAKGTTQQNSGGLMLTETQMRLANVTTQRATEKPIGQTLVVNARLAMDEDRVRVISSRYAGRIDKLFIKETGRVVQAGEPILEMYSETLLTLQKEFLTAGQQAKELGATDSRYIQFANGARKKLLLYGITSEQIDHLTKTGEVQQRITFLAPTGGIVTTVPVVEGQYVDEGSLLYRVADISSLWVEAEVYPGERELMKVGDRMVVRIAGFEDVASDALITFVSPEYRNNSVVTLIRGKIDNAHGKFQPGMQAQVFVRHSQRMALTLPVDAVIRDEHETLIYVQGDDHAFYQRHVKLGLEDVDQTEIISGLKQGEVVAISGAYLLYSELKLRGGSEHIH